MEAQDEFQFDRSFMAKLWVRDIVDGKLQDRMINNGRCARMEADLLYNSRGVARMASAPGSNTSSQDYSTLKQPPLSQVATSYLKPTSPGEVQISPLLAKSNLLITRNVEWANLAVGIKQENRYVIMDVCYPESPVGFIREQTNVIARQILTDAGQYVIRFGSSISKTGLASEIKELEVACPLTLSERAVTLALAISLDNDYFPTWSLGSSLLLRG